MGLEDPTGAGAAAPLPRPRRDAPSQYAGVPLLVGGTDGRTRLLHSAAHTVGELRDEMERVCGVPRAEQMLSSAQKAASVAGAASPIGLAGLDMKLRVSIVLHPGAN